MAAHYLDPNVLDPSLRGQQGDDDYSQAFGTHDASDSQHAESSMAAGARRRSKRTREMEPVRGEERNLFGMSREAETKRTRRQSPSTQPIESNSPFGYHHHPPDANTAFYANPAHRSATDLSVSSLRMSDPYPSGGMDIDDWNSNQQPSTQQAHQGATPAPFSLASPYRGMATYPIGMQPFRYPCLSSSHPPPPPGDPNSQDFKPFDPSIPDYTLEPGPVNLPAPGPSSGQKYSMGPRADCIKCQKGVQGHYGHWISNNNTNQLSNH